MSVFDLRATSGAVSTVLGRYVAQTTAPSAAISAELRRYDGASTTALFSSGIPLQPGALTKAQVDARQVRVLVAGTEVAASVTALRGRHADGTVRSILVQVEAACPAAGTVPVEIRLGETRTIADRAYQRPTDEIAHSGRYILPTSPAYLCETLLTFQRLLPASALTGAELTLATTFFDGRFEALNAGGAQGTAFYDAARAMIATWCRTGTPKYLHRGLQFARGNVLTYLTPGPGSIGPQVPIINPDGRTDGQFPSDGLPNEQYTHAMYDCAVAYLLTGYRDYWLVVSHLVQWQQVFRSAFSSTLYWNASTPRESLTNAGGLCVLAPAAQIDATLPITGGYGTGRAIDFAQQIGWSLDILDTVNFGWSGLRADLIGQRQSVAFAEGGPTFQWAMIESHLIDVYLNLRADPRIPGMVQKLGRTVIRQVQLVTDPGVGGALSPQPYGYSFNTADPLSSVELSGWTLPMHARCFAFLSKFYPAEVIGGATWATWYQRAIQTTGIDPSHLTWQWKILGQIYGTTGGAEASWIAAQSSLAGPSSFVAPTQWATGPTNTPD